MAKKTYRPGAAAPASVERLRVAALPSSRRFRARRSSRTSGFTTTVESFDDLLLQTDDLKILLISKHFLNLNVIVRNLNIFFKLLIFRGVLHRVSRSIQAPELEESLEGSFPAVYTLNPRWTFWAESRSENATRQAPLVGENHENMHRRKFPILEKCLLNHRQYFTV